MASETRALQTLDACPHCGTVQPLPRPTIKSRLIAKGLLNTNKPTSVVLRELGYAESTIDKQSKIVVGSARVKSALTDMARRSLDKASRLERQAETFGKKLEAAAAQADPLQAVQIYGALLRLAQEERKLSGTDSSALTLADRLLSQHVGRRRMRNVIRWAVRNVERASRLADRLDALL